MELRYFKILLFCLSCLTSIAHSAYIKFFMKDGLRYMVETDKLDRFFYKVGREDIQPPLTDSIECNGFVGIPFRDGWVYRIVSGKISLYSYQPRFHHQKFDYVQLDKGDLIPYTLDALRVMQSNAERQYLNSFTPAEATIAYNFEKQHKDISTSAWAVNGNASDQDVEQLVADYIDPFIMKNYASKSVDLWELLSDKPEVQGFYRDPKRALYLYNGLDSLVDHKPWHLKRRQRFSFALKPLAYMPVDALYPDGPHTRRVGALRVRVGDYLGLQYEPLIVHGGDGGFGLSLGLMLFEEDRRFFGSSIAFSPEYVMISGEDPEFRWSFQYQMDLWPGPALYTGVGVVIGWGFREANMDGNTIRSLDRGPFAELCIDLGFSI